MKTKKYRPPKDLHDILQFEEMPGEKLRELRESLGLRQEDVAEAIKRAVITIQHIERGRGGSFSDVVLYRLLLERYAAHNFGLVPVYQNPKTMKGYSGKELLGS